jgi:hypothetical protein
MYCYVIYTNDTHSYIIICASIEMMHTIVKSIVLSHIDYINLSVINYISRSNNLQLYNSIRVLKQNILISYSTLIMSSERVGGSVTMISCCVVVE